MFEQACSERVQQFDDDSDEDLWEEKEMTYTDSAKSDEQKPSPLFVHAPRHPVSHETNLSIN